MPKFNALAALNLVKDMKIDIPFIVISGRSAKLWRSKRCERGA